MKRTPDFCYRWLILLLLILLLGTFTKFFLWERSLMTVTITPNSYVEQANGWIVATTGHLFPGQIQGRKITAASRIEQVRGNVPLAKRAEGALLLMNEAGHPITLQSGVFSDRRGRAVLFNGPITISPLNPPVVTIKAFAAEPGTEGNIAPYDILEPCCGGLFVKSMAFTGGKNAQSTTLVMQNDIDFLANPLSTGLALEAQVNLRSQVKNNERVVDDSLQCQPFTQADHAPGDVATTLVVTVRVMCSEFLYDYPELFALTFSHLQKQVARELGAGFFLEGKTTLTLVEDSADHSENQASLYTSIQGLWIYHFSQVQLCQFAHLIAGKKRAEAQAFLIHQIGVLNINVPGDLPASADEIRIESTFYAHG